MYMCVYKCAYVGACLHVCFIDSIIYRNIFILPNWKRYQGKQWCWRHCTYRNVTASIARCLNWTYKIVLSKKMINVRKKNIYSCVKNFLNKLCVSCRCKNCAPLRNGREGSAYTQWTIWRMCNIGRHICGLCKIFIHLLRRGRR